MRIDARPATGGAPADDPLPGRGLRVLHVTNMWPEGGSFRGIFVLEAVEALRKLGAHVDVEVVAQARGRRDYLLGIPRLRRLVRKGGYDVVHIHHGMTALACRFVGRTPRVLELVGHDINWHWQRWITRLGWGGVAAKIYVSKRMAEVVGDTTGHIIPNGVDFDLFRPLDRAETRRRYEIEDGERVVLFGGLPTNWVKGYDIYSEALAVLRERGLPIRELVLSEANLAREDVAPKFSAADVLLFTSHKGFEGSPTVVKEATAIGLPVVTTDVGDVKEILDGVTGSAAVDWPEPWGTPQTRAILVQHLADRVEEAFAAGVPSNGREHNAWLSWDRIGRTLIELYREVAGARSGRRMKQS